MTYYAFDETEFSTAEECLEYEARFVKLWDAAKFFDEDMNPTPDIGADEKAEWVGENAEYIKIIHADNAAKLIGWIKEYSGMCAELEDFDNGDVLAFDADAWSWKNMTKRMEETKKIIDSVEAKI